MPCHARRVAWFPGPITRLTSENQFIQYSTGFTLMAAQRRTG
jgi:hypothetical protein